MEYQTRKKRPTKGGEKMENWKEREASPPPSWAAHSVSRSRTYEYGEMAACLQCPKGP